MNLSIVQIGLVKATLYLETYINFYSYFHMYSPIWLIFCVNYLNIKLLNIYKFRNIGA